MMLMNPRMLVVGLLMVAGAGLAVAMEPTQKIADAAAKVDLDTMIPRQIGGWSIDPSLVPIEPSPEVTAELNRIYNQTLSRTYVNAVGQRIMVSIAYGGNQSDSTRVHRPEACYSAQGFEIRDATVGALITQYGPLPVKRLLAVQGDRVEPITYWIVIGDKATPVGIEEKFAQLRYGLTGRIPDGFLVRVSSIDRDLTGAYRRQEDFVRAMLGAMSESDRVRILGRLHS